MIKNRILSLLLAISLVIGSMAYIAEPSTVQAAQDIIKINPKTVSDVEKITPLATISYPAGTANEYNYVFQFTIKKLSTVRIAGLSRYTFYNWNGKTFYTLTDSLDESKATSKYTWRTYVNADLSWSKRSGNYCDKTYVLDKGTYYLFVNTTLCDGWRDHKYANHTTSDFDLGFWLSINASDYTKAPTLKSLKNKKKLKLQVKFSKSKYVSGYNIQYSTSKNFKKPKKISTSKTTVTIKKSIKKKKTYYVRVRAYRIYAGKKRYSVWSNVKSIKIRK